jgi:NTF2-like N-terminal transpeptidase domain
MTKTQYSEVASQFASSLVKGDFSSAHSILSQSLKEQLSIAQLQERYNNMTAYSGESAESVEVEETMNEWSQKELNDVGWAYVSISGKSFSEAVTVVICEEDGKFCVCDVVWGRP